MPDLSNDFDTVLVVDLNRNVIYRGFGYRLTCALGTSLEAQSAGALSNLVFAGDSAGFVNQLDPQNLHVLGAPGTVFKYTVASGSTAMTVKVSGTLLTAGAGLADCRIMVVSASDGMVRERTVLSNDADEMLVTQGFGTLPVAGDTVYIGPHWIRLMFTAGVFENPAALESLSIDAYSASADNTRFIWRVYGPDAANGTHIDRETPTIIVRDNFTMTDVKRGSGKKHFRPASRKALAYDVAWITPPDGAIQVSGFRVMETGARHEQGRGV